MRRMSIMTMTRSLAVVVVMVGLLAGAPSALGSYAGTLDPSFGHAGRAVGQPVAGQQNTADALTVLPDGRILAAGYATANLAAPAGAATAIVERLNPDGSPDTSFGTGGRLVLGDVPGFTPPLAATRGPSGVELVRIKLLVLPDGRFLVLGRRLVRVRADG